MEAKTPSLEFIDPSPPESLIPDTAWPTWWIAAGVITLIIAVGILWLLLRRRTASENPASLRNAAFQEACDALAEITTPDLRTVAIHCSLILRHYLAKATGDPALFETHEEFISRHDSLKDLTEAARTAAKSGFDRLVSWKYAADIPDVPADQVTAECRELLKTLHQGFAS